MFCPFPKLRRQELLSKNEIPTQSEIKYFLRQNLANAFFEYSHSNIKQSLGITTLLREINEDLCISPRDELKEKICLKLLSHNKYIKACTHNGILKLGEQAIQRWKAETTEKLLNDLKANEEDTRLMFEAEKRYAVNLAIKHVSNIYKIQLDNLVKQHEHKLKLSVAKVIRKSNEKLENIVMRERINVTRQMMEKLRDEISHIVIYLCEEFDREFQAQKDIMVSEFNQILRQERKLAENKLKTFQKQRTEDLQRLRTELNEDFNNQIADIIHAEQINIQAQQHSLYQYLQRKNEALENLLVEAKYVIEILGINQKRSRSADNYEWRRKLCEIIRQFKTFINLALKTVPGQKEIIRFLESVLCEKDDEDSETNSSKIKINWDLMKKQEKNYNRSMERREKFQVTAIIDKNGKKWRPIQLLPDAPELHCTEEQLLSPIVKSEINICHDDNYYIDKDSAILRSTSASDDSPFARFKNKLYVRFDYEPNAEESSAEIKPVTELIEGSRFIMGLNDLGPCNILINDIRDDLSSSKYNEIKRSMNDDKSLEKTFKMRVHNLIDAIQQVEYDSSNTPGKSTRSNDQEKAMHDLVNNLKKIKGGEKISDKSPTTCEINEKKIEQSACTRVESIIKILRLNPSLQNVLIQTSNNI